MTLDEFRAKNPAYKDVPDQQLADGLYNKFYAGKMDRGAFDKMVGYAAAPGNGIESTVDNFMRGAADFLTFGAADEIAAALSSATGIGSQGNSTYSGNLAAERERNATGGPAFAAGQAAGAIVPLIATAGASAPLTGAQLAMAAERTAAPTLASTAAKVAGYASAGGLYGGVYGFNSGEGGFNQRSGSGTTGAAFGAVAGVVLPTAINLIGRYGAKAADMLTGMFGKSNPAGQQLPSSVKLVMDAMKADKITPEEAIARLKAMGSQSAVADLGGEVAPGSNVQQLARAVGQEPGAPAATAAQFLTERRAGSGLRVRDAMLSEMSGGKDPQMFAVMDNLDKQRVATSAPLYESAFKANQSVDSPALERVLQTPFGQDALATARTRMANKMSLMGKPDAELGAVARELASMGKMNYPEGGVANGLKLQTWDQIKQAMDEEIGAIRRKVINGTGKAGDLRDAIALKKQLVAELDRLDTTGRAGPNSFKTDGGDYAKARAAYAGPSAQKDAVELGADFLKTHPDQIKAQLADMTPAEQEYYRIGAAQALQDMVENVSDGRDLFDKIWSKELMRQRLAVIFPDQQALQRFVAVVRNEHQMMGTANFASPTVGSQTEPRNLAAGWLNNRRMQAIASAISDLVRGKPSSAITNAGRAIIPSLGRATATQRANALAPLLFTDNPDVKNGLLASIQNYARDQRVQNALNSPMFFVNQMGQNALLPAR